MYSELSNEKYSYTCLMLGLSLKLFVIIIKMIVIVILFKLIYLVIT